MVLVAKGDRAAFARLATQFAPKIEAYTTRILGGSIAAQDTTQEVMVRLWLRAGVYAGCHRSLPTPNAWLCPRDSPKARPRAAFSACWQTITAGSPPSESSWAKWKATAAA